MTNDVTTADDNLMTETQSTVDRIVALNKQVDLDLPQEENELWDFVIRLENEASVNLAKRGLAYMMLKEMSARADFLSELSTRDISRQRAQEAMSVARMLMALPASKTKSISLLGNRKLIELARIPTETLDELSENGELDLDEVDTMSVRELKRYVRQLKAKTEAAVFKQEAAELKVDDLLMSREAAPETDLHPAVAKVRMDGAVLSQQAIDGLDAMQSLFDELIQQSMDLFRSQPAQFEAAKASLYLHLNSVHAKAAIAVQAFLDTFGEVDVSEASVPLMSNDEAVRFLQLRKVATLDYHAGELARAAKVAEKTQKNKPGPKKGSKRKKVTEA